MLSQPDFDLVGRDSALPGLASCLDPVALLATLRESIPALEDLRSIRVDYLRYKPGTNCIAALTFDLAGSTTLAYAKAHRTSELPRLASRVQPTSLFDFFLPSIATELHLFPSDLKLPCLPRVSDLAWASQRTPLPTPGAFRSPVVSIEPLAYKPERRFVARWNLEDGRRFVAKSYRASDFESARHNATFAKDCLTLPLPRLANAREHRATLVFPWTHGQSLVQTLRDSEEPLAAFEAVGESLARFHQQPVPSHLTARSHADQVARLTALLQPIAYLAPEARPELERLLPALIRTIQSLQPSLHLCHGDFHAGQVLLTQDGPHFLDLDELHAGDPVTDLASFAAHLEREALAGSMSPARRDAIQDAFLKGYARMRNAPTPPHLPALIAARLLAETPHFFRTRNQDWTARTLAAVTRAAQLAGVYLTASPRTPGPHIPSPVAEDPALPLLAGALDASAAADLILPAIADRLRLTAPRLARIQIRRHKPGRRCLIEYGVTHSASPSPVSVLGKLRRRGVDAANFALLQDLAHGDFSPTADDGIAIPNPIAAIPALGLVLHAWVPGSPLTQYLSHPEAPHLGSRAADALIKLHRSRQVIARSHSVTDELDHLRVQLTQTAERLPTWRLAILRILEECVRRAERLAPIQSTLLHRDIYPDQILVDGPRLWIVDLDLAAMGDPALDAGNFIAHLMEHALRVLEDLTALAPIEHAFRERFLKRAQVLEESLETWTTLALARHIAISTRMADRAHITPQLIALCERRLTLGLGRIPTSPGPTSPLS